MQEGGSEAAVARLALKTDQPEDDMCSSSTVAVGVDQAGL